MQRASLLSTTNLPRVMRVWPGSLSRPIAFFRNNVDKLGPRKGDKVVVAMSGGVDSSVVATLLSHKDYDLSAIYMRNWDTRDESGTDNGCEWKKDYADVQKVCKLLDVPCKLVDLTREYWLRVFEPSLAAWETGATPNPDVWCNREVKFGALMRHLSSPDTWIATGHYARKAWDTTLPTPRPQLRRAADRHKDQTYYLSSIPERSLARALFPLAPYTKPQVRDLAHDFKLPTADRKESMGICFVGEKRRFETFIGEYIPSKPGNIVELSTGKVVGQHDGLWRFTIGQRARIMSMPDKAFVAGKDIAKNEIQVVLGTTNPALYSRAIVARNWNWIWADSPPSALLPGPGNESGNSVGKGVMRARVQHRHRMDDIGCIVRRLSSGAEKGERLYIEFDEPQDRVALGQVAALWDGVWCLGCGIIEDAIK